MKSLFQLVACAALIAAAHAQVHVSVPGVDVPNPGRNDIAIDTNRNVRTVTCKSGGGLYVRGNSNTLQVDGVCSVVFVLGNSNTIAVAQRTRILTQGNNNIVSYTDSRTVVSNPGNRNTVGPAGK